MWAVTAQVETRTMGSSGQEWHGSVQVPTFYLNENVQGIVSEDHAIHIARDIIDPLHQIPDSRIHLSAVKL